MQPQHPEYPRMPFTAFLPFPAEKLLAHTREPTCCICLRRAQIRSPCHPGAPVTGGCGAAADCPCICFCYISKSGVPRSLTFPGLVFCCAFNPLPPPPPAPSSPPAERPSSWAASSPLLSHSQRLQNLLKALPVFQVRKNFYEVSALFFH